ncbi:hypothetical protein [Maritalea porphyrae]|uniref:hypothetical protein n=1 Tax=Maritalea porphyrae TaxID=880732 RepID=UPI0022AFCCE2|nr:hypothetical protein [Maritalea porphyrae]MCZ4273231.1 hypothetical protein [Maritalea porphyrae]
MENQPQQTEGVADVAAPAEEPKAKPVAEHVRKNERCKNVPLEWPISFDGKEYKEITIRRATGMEIAEYIGHLASGDANVQPPFIDCPAEVYAVLDDEDLVTIDEELKPFLSERYLKVVNYTPET